MNNVEQENSNYEKKIKELNEKIEILEANNNNNITNNDEDTINKIKELEKKNSELENEYMTKITQLNDYIMTLETGQGVSEQMEKLKNKIKQQENILISLTNQLKEYQSKTDNIINANGNNDNENILTLIKEVKSIRQRILDIVTYNNKIDNFDEFIKILENIKNNINYEENMNKLNGLIEHYKKNNDKSILDLYDQFYK
jgi:DNA repair exonuclease SbcCD ATPase subunit